jgi:hypothetical protein
MLLSKLQMSELQRWISRRSTAYKEPARRFALVLLTVPSPRGGDGETFEALKKTLKLRLRGDAHSSIRVEKGQPALPPIRRAVPAFITATPALFRAAAR